MIELRVVVDVHPDGILDRDPTGYTCGYVAATLRCAGIRVHDVCVAAADRAQRATTAIDVGPGVRRALADAADAMATIDAHEPPDPARLPVHEAIVEAAQTERRRFDPDAARARAADAATMGEWS